VIRLAISARFTALAVAIGAAQAQPTRHFLPIATVVGRPDRRSPNADHWHAAC
jgi:hypothetical protein